MPVRLFREEDCLTNGTAQLMCSPGNLPSSHSALTHGTGDGSESVASAPLCARRAVHTASSETESVAWVVYPTVLKVYSGCAQGLSWP